MTRTNVKVLVVCRNIKWQHFILVSVLLVLPAASDDDERGNETVRCRQLKKARKMLLTAEGSFRVG